MNFIPIRAYDNYIKASIDLSLLKAEGVICHLKDEYTVTIDPLLSPALGGMKLMVAGAEMARAQRLLDDSDKLYLQTVPCPFCKHNSLEKIVETTQYHTWAGKIKSLLINGQEQAVKKFFRCTNCGKEITDLPSTV